MSMYDGGLMEPDRPLGYHYPAGTPGPRSKAVVFKCEEDDCGHEFEGRIIYDLGTADLVPEVCPVCKSERIKKCVTKTGPAMTEYRLTPGQVRALAAGDPGEENEAEVLAALSDPRPLPIQGVECDHCGEPLGDEAQAELYFPLTKTKLFVHAEPCGEYLLARGWEIA